MRELGYKQNTAKNNKLCHITAILQGWKLAALLLFSITYLLSIQNLGSFFSGSSVSSELKSRYMDEARGMQPGKGKEGNRTVWENSFPDFPKIRL